VDIKTFDLGVRLTVRLKTLTLPVSFILVGLWFPCDKTNTFDLVTLVFDVLIEKNKFALSFEW
jgi:hypothetical protein